MPRFLLTVVFVLAVSRSFAETGNRSLTWSCPAYRARLTEARERLEQGDRSGAVAALEKAEAALRVCAGEEGEAKLALLATR